MKCTHAAGRVRLRPVSCRFAQGHVSRETLLCFRSPVWAAIHAYFRVLYRAKVELDQLDSLRYQRDIAVWSVRLHLHATDSLCYTFSTPNELGHSGSNRSHAADESIDFSSRGDINKANTSTGQGKERDAATDDKGSPEVLNWKLSSLDFDRYVSVCPKEVCDLCMCA